MGAVKGEPHDEEVPSPTVQQSNTDSSAAPQQQQQSADLSAQYAVDPQTSQSLEEVPIAVADDGTGNVQRYLHFLSWFIR